MHVSNVLGVDSMLTRAWRKSFWYDKREREFVFLILHPSHQILDVLKVVGEGLQNVAIRIFVVDTHRWPVIDLPEWKETILLSLKIGQCEVIDVAVCAPFSCC